MVQVSEQQLSIIGQCLTRILSSGLEDQDGSTTQANELTAKTKSVLNLISTLQKQGQGQGQASLKGGSAYMQQHQACCPTCASGQVKQLLSRCIPVSTY